MCFGKIIFMYFILVTQKFETGAAEMGSNPILKKLVHLHKLKC